MAELLLYIALLCAAIACVSGLPQSNRASARKQPAPPRQEPQRGSVISREDVAPNSKPGLCPDDYENVIFLAGDQCDTYTRCINTTAYPETCPDGLLFVADRGYPCAYPQEVECGERGSVDFTAAREPGSCKHDYEIFFSPKDDIDCAGYTSCVEGVPYVRSCQEAHAFDAVKMACVYADDVDTCDTEAYLGFSCEQIAFTDQEIGNYVSVPSPGECQKYYSCINKEDGSVLPRPQSCPEYTAFNSTSGICSDYPHLIPGCEDLYPAELIEAILQHKQQKKSRRQQRLG